MIRPVHWLCCFLMIFLSAAAVSVSQEPAVRIALKDDLKDFSIGIRGRYQIVDPKTNSILAEGRILRKALVTGSRNGIQIGKTQYPQRHLRIIPRNDVTLGYDNKDHRYRENIDLVLGNDQHFLLINTIDIEQYIKGVLYHEVSHRWPLEAIKAQAVAVRTYALYQMQENKDNLYDVRSDIYSQVYGGKNAERYRTNVAVNRTRGEALFFKNQILPAYYSSNCAGHTEDVTELWDQDLAPLKGVECSFCQGAPNSMWKKNFRSRDVQDKLVENGFKIGAIEDIKIVETTSSGRVKTLEFKDRDGKKVQVPGKVLRTLLGPNILKSNMYDIVMKGYYFDVYGRGWGHGVGMCQWGAYGMSLQKFNYKEILNYYYPGTELRKL